MIRLLLAITVAAALVLPAWAADKLKLTAGAEDGFGRLSLAWDGPAAIEAHISNGKLVVTFDRPFEVNVESLAADLPAYLDGAELNADKQGLVIGLLRPVRLRQTASEHMHVIDLVDTAKPGAETAAQLESVGVRGGDHSNFGRLVFDWRKIVAFEIERIGDAVEVIFAEAATLDIGSLGNFPPYGMKGIEVDVADGRARARLQIMPGSRIRHFRSGPKFVLDVLPPVDAPKLAEVRGYEDAKPAPVPPRAPARAEPAPEGAQQLWRPSQPKSGSSFLQVAGGAQAPVGQPTPLVTTPAKAAEAKAGDAKAMVAGGPGAEPAKPAVAQAEAAAKPAAKAEPAADDPASGGQKITYAELEGGAGADLGFEWPAPVPAGAFARGNQLWLVFDRPDVPSLAGIGRREGAVQAAQAMRNNRATIIRLTLADGMHAGLSRDRATWRLAVRPQKVNPAAELAVLSQPYAEDGPRVFVPVIDTGRRVVVFDPEVGDELQVVPLLPSGHGVAQRRRFAEFAVLDSLQGVVVQPFTENLQVLPLRNGVAVAGKEKLHLSAPDVTTLDAGNTELSLAFKGPLLQLRSWRGDPKLSVVERHQRLQRLVARAPAGGRNVARWELARFYTAQGMAPEALAMFGLMQQGEAQLDQDPMFRAMRGIASLKLHRLQAAERDLLHPDLDRFPDIALWRGMLYSAQGKFVDAMRAYAIGTSHLEDLNPAQRELALLGWARAAVGTDDKATFKKAVDAMKGLPPSRRVDGYVNLWQGTLAEADGDLAGALAGYTAAIEADYRPARAEAALAAADVALKLKKIDNAEAIAQLERLHFGWRGDDFEVRLRQRLSQLKVARKDYREGMEQLRQAMINLPSAPGMEEVSLQLKAVFEELFLEGAADALPPVEALALYYEFEELTPVGRKGDKLIGDLAERLASVDLLDRAQRLLEHQIAYRLQGQEKSQAGARLASIYLADKQPDKAIEALDKSRWQLNPVPLQTQRRHLEAKALADSGDVARTLALLGEDGSREAGQIRAEMFWKQREWTQAAGELDKLLGDRWKDEAELDDTARQTVIKLAIARYLSEDDAGLAELRQRYGKKMAEGLESDTFALLTGTIDPSAVAFRELGKKIANLDQVDAFLASYRQNHAGGQEGTAIN